MLNIASENASKRRTGLIFDDRMAEHYCLWDSGHIERPERYLSSLKRCREYGLVDRCCILPSRFATESELRLVHTEKYIKEVRNSKTINNAEELEMLSSIYDGVYFNRSTYDCALLAVGCTLELVSAVLKGSLNNGLAIVRPPGHHAMVEAACGFCFFNNIAIAAKYALQNFNLQKILIVDFDVHHGQGTQQIFYNDPRVLYFSIHRYENGKFWPHLKESHFNCIGDQSGQGYTINVPLNGTGLENADYLAIFNNVLLPIAYEYNPELVLISAGYDAALGCPEGEMRVSPQAYPHFLNSLSCLANGRVCVILEGGYCIPSLSEGVALTLRGLLGDPCPVISPSKSVHKITRESILNTLAFQRHFWDSAKLQSVYHRDSDNDSNRKHHVNLSYLGNPLEGTTSFKTREDYPIQSEDFVKSLHTEIKELIAETDLSLPEKCTTGLVFDAKANYPQCTFFNHLDSAHHAMTFFKKLKSSNLLAKCWLLQSPEVPEVELALLQDAVYLGQSVAALENKHKILEEIRKEFKMAKPCHNGDNIVDASDRLLVLIDSVASRKYTNGLAIIRPTGHFPDNENPSGFCTLSSVAIAAQYLLNISEYKMDKVLILDLDVQHNNSLQNIFYEDNRVLTMSLHYHDNELFPATSGAREKQVGENLGKGYNINIPFNHPMCDGDYLASLFHIILPTAYEFSPQFILVSLGLSDYTNNTHLSTSCFAVIIKLLSALCNGKIVVVSEGNFCNESAPDMVAHCLSTLLGENCVSLRSVKPTSEAITTIRNVVRVQKDNWKCMAFDFELPDGFDLISMQGISCGSNNSGGSASGSVTKRRQSSDPVDIPKIPAEVEATFLLDHARGEVFTNEFFCVTPLENCPHLELLQPIPSEGLNPFAACLACKDYSENWVCLHCYQVYCGRFINQHMMQHGLDMNHYLTLSYSDLSVWCYACDAYIHNNLLVSIKEHAHDKKFNAA